MADDLVERLRRGQLTGEVVTDLDLSALADALFGTLLFWVLTDRQGSDQVAAVDVLRVVLRGVLAESRGDIDVSAPAGGTGARSSRRSPLLGSRGRGGAW